MDKRLATVVKYTFCKEQKCKYVSFYYYYFNVLFYQKQKYEEY